MLTYLKILNRKLISQDKKYHSCQSQFSPRNNVPLLVLLHVTAISTPPWIVVRKPSCSSNSCLAAKRGFLSLLIFFFFFFFLFPCQRAKKSRGKGLPLPPFHLSSPRLAKEKRGGESEKKEREENAGKSGQSRERKRRRRKERKKSEKNPYL